MRKYINLDKEEIMNTLGKCLLTVTAACLPLMLHIHESLADASITAAAKRAVAPDFELDDLKGEAVRLSQFKGKVVVINFWATWCAPCKQEIPHLNRILKNYKEQGLVILTISTDSPQTQSQVGRLARRWKTHTLLDPEGRVVAQLNPRGLAPYTLIVDRNGKIAFDHDGYHSGDEVKLEAAVKKILKEPKK